MGVRGEIFSTKVMLQNRTYFFNVKENRLGDLYLNIVESKNRDEGGFDRQSVILFAEDLQQFLQGFDESLRVLEKAAREKRRPKNSDAPTGYRQNRQNQSEDRNGNRSFDSSRREEPRRYKKRGRPAESREHSQRHEAREHGPRHESREQSSRYESREQKPRYESREQNQRHEAREYNPQYERKRKDAPRRKRVVVKKS
ncbi:MAG: DUF3276 family protein [Treponema sp.]|jgi:hypothetical protein|nr:DUF3276 family protein [Treponema sp.]